MTRKFWTIRTLPATAAAWCAALCLMIAAGSRVEAGSVGALGSAVENHFDGVTLVDLSRGATDTGTYSNATVLWVSGGEASCSAAFTLKFYRPSEAGTQLTFLDERGPFDSHLGLIDVTLSPPVSLNQGDLIGITELAAAPCGGVAIVTGGGGDHTASFHGDLGTASTSVCDHDADLLSQTIAVLARTDGTEVRAGIVPGAGSVHGAANSNFKTSIQLFNPFLYPIQGRLVFHPIGVPGSASDPSIPYSLAGLHSTSFPDVVAAFGVTGLGSIDVMASSSYVPLVTTHVFNDAGADGTAGYSEPLVRPGDQYVIEPGESAWLATPDDFTKYRMNIGIRTLSEATVLNFGVWRSNGSLVKILQKGYAADFLDLQLAQTLLDGFVLEPGDVIEVQVGAGRAIVLGITVDNKTNDTALQLGNRFGY